VAYDLFEGMRVKLRGLAGMTKAEAK